MARDNAKSIWGISAGWSDNVLDEDIADEGDGGNHKLWLAMLIDKIPKWEQYICILVHKKRNNNHEVRRRNNDYNEP